MYVTCLPELDLAANYPTIGPQGSHTMNVNGLAIAIELYLGSDILIDGGAYRPVVWQGYVKAMNAYQGEVADKETIHTLFRHKAELAAESPEVMATQDWSGLDLILDHIVSLLRAISMAGA